MLKIVPYTYLHQPVFRQLNYDWIHRYFWIEEADRRVLDDPQHYILDKGGYILMAESEGEVVGTCALIPVGENVFELAKMAVAESARRKGIGYALGLASIEKAREAGASKVELLSNTKLSSAMLLYKKLGFSEVPLPETEYERANIKMEMVLKSEV